MTSAPTAEGVNDSIHAPNSNKGKAKAQEQDTNMEIEKSTSSNEPPTTTSTTEQNFIKVPKATKFSVTAPWAAVPGEQT